MGVDWGFPRTPFGHHVMEEIMHRWVFAILLLISSSAFADEWSREDSYREATYLTLHTVDWLQTRNISRSAECKTGQPPPCWHEQNTLLGKCPSIAQVNQYFAATAALQFAVAYYLPAEYRKAFQYVTIGIEGGAVAHNFSIGISGKF